MSFLTELKIQVFVYKKIKMTILRDVRFLFRVSKNRLPFPLLAIIIIYDYLDISNLLFTLAG